jgi:hypothetical protein|tara:strand:+ start:395 stop:1666 length:1272 start_codon:yes stop_codon:yes gene_type:complete
MSVPTLSPKQSTSPIVLPATGSEAKVSAAVPLGMYTGSAEFLSGAASQVKYTYRKLGGDVLDIELTPENVYANFEEAVLEYSYLINTHQGKNILSTILGATTGTFDHRGELRPGDSLSSSLGGKGVELRYPQIRFEYARRVGNAVAFDAGLGGVVREYSASIEIKQEVQDYDLQSIVATAAAAGGVDFASIDTSKRIIVNRVFYKTPRSMWRFYGYYGGLNVVGNLATYGQYADDSTFELIPVWQNKLQAMNFEDMIYTRTSHFSYELRDNRLRIFPQPLTSEIGQMWFTFQVLDDAWNVDTTRKDGVDGVNNLNTIPFSNIPYENINSVGKQWIRRFALALSKETLGQIRGKFGTIPIPGESLTLNASDLLSQAQTEQTSLRDELKSVLDEMVYTALAEKDAAMANNMTTIKQQAPLPIFQG